MPISSRNFLEALPDVVFYAVMEQLPGRVIENTVRRLSRNCYRRIELRRARLPRVDIDELDVYGNEFWYEPAFRLSRNRYIETIDSTNLMQHLEYLAERATFTRLSLLDVNWEVFANCKFDCQKLLCHVESSTLLPERFIDIFCSIRPTESLDIRAVGETKVFPVTSDFLTNNYAVGLKEVRLFGCGSAIVDPLNDTILLNLRLLRLEDYFDKHGCTLNGIQAMIQDWYTSDRQIDRIDLWAVGGEAERRNFMRNLPPSQVQEIISTYTIITLRRANGDVVEIRVNGDGIIHLSYSDSTSIKMTRLVPDPEAGSYRRYDAVR